MSLRFQRRLKIAPGVRLNMSLGGISVTTGVRGASLTFSRRGVHANLGLPGSGLYYRTRLSTLSIPGVGADRRRELGDDEVQLYLDDDGRLLLLDGAGEPLSEGRARRVRRERRAVIDAWLDARCAALNEARQRALGLHLATPDPRRIPAPMEPASAAPDEPPAPYQPSAWESLLAANLGWMRDRIDYRRRESERALAEWEAARDAREAAGLRAAWARRVLAARAVDIQADPQALTERLAELLEAIPWPLETGLSLAVRDRSVLLDVDLPELEDMPPEEARRSKRPLGIRLHRRSERAIRQDYMRHVHAVGFRLVGEAFLAAPGAERVVISACTQRVDGATGAISEVYLYSARVDRAGWEAIRFDRLEAVDPVAALGRFELRRRMSKTGIFKPIAPFES